MAGGWVDSLEGSGRGLMQRRGAGVALLHHTGPLQCTGPGVLLLLTVVVVATVWETCCVCMLLQQAVRWAVSCACGQYASTHQGCPGDPSNGQCRCVHGKGAAAWAASRCTCMYCGLAAGW
jgi:hypothetical protein